MDFLETIGSLIVAALFAGLLGLLVAGFVKRVTGFLDDAVQLRVQQAVLVVVAILGFIWMVRDDRVDRFLASSEAAKLASTIWGVLLAVGISAVVFVAANALYDQAGKSYTRFSTLLGAVIGFVTFGLLDGNRLIQYINGRDALSEALHDVVNANEWTLLLFSMIIGGLMGLGLGYGAGVVRDDITRFQYGGLAVGLVGGFLWGLFFAERIPVDTTIALLWTP
ncbi:MAG: hypothetical protein ACR2QK_11360, partial [Acidimicrobiales bacterium]